MIVNFEESFSGEENKVSLLKKSIQHSNAASILCKIEPTNINFLGIVDCNNKFLQCFGLDKEDVVGRSYDFLLEQGNIEYGSVGYLEYINLVKFAKKKQEASINVQIPHTKKIVERDEFMVTLLPLKLKTRNNYCILSFRKLDTTSNINLESPVLIKNLERALRNETILREASDIIASEPDLQEVFIQISKMIYQYLKIDRCIIYKFYEAGYSLVVEHCGDHREKISDQYKPESCRPSASQNFQNQRFLGQQSANKDGDVHNHSDTQSMLDQYINFQYQIFTDLSFSRNKNHTIINNDIRNDSRFRDVEDMYFELKICSQIVVTMVTAGNIVGTLYLHQSSSRNWLAEEIGVIEIIADELAVATDRANYARNLRIFNSGLIEGSNKLSKELREEKEMRALQNEFVALVSHEFKTPLQIIDGSRELITRKVRALNIVENLIDQPLERIRNAVNRMNSLIQNNLNLFKIATTETKIEVHKKDFDISYLIEDIIEKHSNLAKIKNIDIELDIQDLPNFYNGDQKLIDHSFTNIIENALKYSRENSSIKVCGGLKDGQLFFEVKDNGIGIPKQDLLKIGRKFFRATNTTEITGTGVGIYLTKYFIELHSGSFLLASELNIGTTITVLLPIQQPILV